MATEVASHRQLMGFIDRKLGKHGINSASQAEEDIYADITFNPNGLLYTSFHSSIMDKWIVTVSDPEKKGNIIGKVIYTIDKDTGVVTILESEFK